MILTYVISTLASFLYPTFAILISFFIGDLSTLTGDELATNAKWLAFEFFILGIWFWLLEGSKQYFFIYLEQKFTVRIKTAVFSKLLHLDPGWHDKKDNSIGAITGLLSTDIDQLKNLNGLQVAAMITSFVGFFFSMAVALWASWRLTLTIFILIPIGSGAFFKLFRFIKIAAMKDNTAYKKSVSFISDATQNIKTVLSLGHEKQMIKLYKKTLEVPLEQAAGKSFRGGLFSAMFILILFWVYGLILIAGAYLVRSNDLTVTKMLISMFSVVFSLFGFATLAFYLPN